MMKKINSSDALTSLLEITEELSDVEHLQSFIDNMKHLNLGNNWNLFEWWEHYLSWSELSTEKDMENYYGN